MPIIRYFVFMGLVLAGFIWAAGAFLLPPIAENAAATPASQKQSAEQAAAQAAALAKQKTNAIYHIPASAQTAGSVSAAPAAKDQDSRQAASAKTNRVRTASPQKKKRTKTTVTGRQRHDGTQVVDQGNTRTFFEF